MNNFFTAIALDDNKAALNDLEQVLKKYLPEIRLVAKCTHRRKVEAYLKKHGPVDLFFCDIRLGNENGLKVAKELKTYYSILLLFSDYADHKEEAIGLGPDAYLEKPVDHVQVREKIEKLVRIREHAGVMYGLERGVLVGDAETGRRVQVSVRLITAITTVKVNHLHVIMPEGRILVRKSLTRMMKQLNADPLFVRLGKGTCVALAAITHIDKRMVYLNNGYFFPVTRNYYPELKQRIGGDGHEA